jgi:hypothetical protein
MANERNTIMRATHRSAVAVTIALGLCLTGEAAPAADKNAQKCTDGSAKAIQKFSATMLKELAKCREKPEIPYTAQCDESLKKIDKAAGKRDKSIVKACKSLDPVLAFQYTGCQAFGCDAGDTTAAGYQTCIACATDGAMARLSRAVTNSCGNGFVDAGEECDGNHPLCDARCQIGSVCGNDMLEPHEECDTSVSGSTCAGEGYQCVPVGLEKECTCVPPCALDPVPARVAFETDPPSDGACGCTLTDPNVTTCSGASKVADLQCGKLLVGGGLSAVPPGPTPDGATTYVGLPVCFGTELIIGGDAAEDLPMGDRRKRCSKGFDAGNPQCFFGPALGVVNNTAPLSTCVINALKQDLRGTMNAATGHATMTAELESKVFLTGDLISGRCRGGSMPGKPCIRNEPARGGCAECVGSTNAGQGCEDDTDCPGGSCNGLCATDVNAQCDVGANAGMACTVPVCDSGASVGELCGSTCPSCGLTTTSICNGGVNQGDLCDDDGDCPGSTCTTSDCPGGTCTATTKPVQPCPVCVDDKFNPISDGSTGTCDLGANRNGSCSSTNSDGLTIDCAPIVGQELDDLPITLKNMTTGQATMVADADGSFCNFGLCEGGGRPGEDCNNDAECEGGTCHKRCQTTENSPFKGNLCENDDQCIGETVGYCGQAESGAFIREAGGPTVRRIIENGRPAAAPVAVGDPPKPSTVGAVFCIPVTEDQAINSAGSLPGPGAVSIEGTFTVFGKCVGGSAPPNTYCRNDSDCPGGSCG